MTQPKEEQPVITEVLTPVRRYYNDENGEESHDTRTFLVTEDFGDGDVGFHVSPNDGDVVTVMFTVEDGWRFLRELARTLVDAERGTP